MIKLEISDEGHSAIAQFLGAYRESQEAQGRLKEAEHKMTSLLSEELCLGESFCFVSSMNGESVVIAVEKDEARGFTANVLRNVRRLR